MLEASPDTLKNILQAGGMKPATETSVLSSFDTTKPAPTISTGTNFIKDITDLLKATGELLNTDFGKIILNKATGKEEAGAVESFNNEMIKAKAIESEPAPAQREQPKTEIQKADTQKEASYNLTEEQIYLMLYNMVAQVSEQDKKITAEEILKSLEDNKEDIIKKLNEVFNNGEHTGNK